MSLPRDARYRPFSTLSLSLSLSLTLPIFPFFFSPFLSLSRSRRRAGHDAFRGDLHSISLHRAVSSAYRFSRAYSSFPSTGSVSLSACSCT